MSREFKDSWLDSLARWTVRGHETRAPAATASGGTTRRSALRLAAGAAGAAALGGPLGLAGPPRAAADQASRSKCVSESFKSVYAVFQACVKTPLEELEEALELLRLYETVPPPKTAAKKRRQKKEVARIIRKREKAIADSEFCNILFARERAEGEEACQSQAKPPAESTNGSGNVTPGCEPGYLLCGDYCCDLSVATCAGCQTPTCCRIEGNCCPGGAAA
ncbi:MAG: hypothetical protein ACRDPE_07810 [Solirubrobacterales bacterium]